MKVDKKAFVKKFLKDDKNIIWPREMKIVKTLFSIFNDEVFWATLTLPFKLNSLCWFLSDDGRAYLNKEYNKFKLELPEQKIFQLDNNIDISDKKEETEKVLSLRDFLKLWPKKTA